MIKYRCKDCLWWDNQHPSVDDILVELKVMGNKVLSKDTPGFCRRRKASSLQIGKYVYGAHPIMDADEFCGEFKENK